MAQPTQLEKRLASLEAHLAQENPVLLRAVKSFRDLDTVARRLGFFNQEESYATRVPWWPLIAVLGTYSAGKSTFLNAYLGYKLQLTGNQAVDDKFTVVCFSNEDGVRVLPGLALDADPRFPFYQISRAIEETAPGEGRRIDAYLQLKTCPSEAVRAKILIDSPGFDADAQRTSTLRITNHIVDLSDLVLVFFDARHPEVGTMHDTLEHLVSQTIVRPDSNKFLYILNQIDATAKEDNPEDVVASWQRALAQAGLTAGRFYRIYDKEAATPIDDEALRARFEAKRDEDMAEIYARMQQVEVDRAYRIVGILEQTVHDITEKVIPKLQGMLEQWRRRVLWADGIVFGAILAGILIWTLATGEWAGGVGSVLHASLLVGTLQRPGVALGCSGRCRRRGGVYPPDYPPISCQIGHRRNCGVRPADMREQDLLDNFIAAFRKNTSIWHSVLHKRPVGWGKRAQRRLREVLIEANRYVQDLNDKFTNPSGKGVPIPKPAVEVEKPEQVGA